MVTFVRAQKSLVCKQHKESITICRGVLLLPSARRHLMSISCRGFRNELGNPKFHDYFQDVGMTVLAVLESA